jgi:hypothetical protein
MKRPPVIRVTVRTLADVDLMDANNDRRATDLLERLRKVVAGDDVMRVIERVGCNTFDDDSPRRYIGVERCSRELLTARVCARALRWLFEHHPEAAPYRLRPGAEGCASIRSAKRLVVAEIWAGNTTDGNQRLAMAAAKLERMQANRKLLIYSFIMHPIAEPKPAAGSPGVEILSLGPSW